jgi:hypothetical protein
MLVRCVLIGSIGMAIVPVRTLAQPAPAATPPVVTDKAEVEVVRQYVDARLFPVSRPCSRTTSAPGWCSPATGGGQAIIV